MVARVTAVAETTPGAAPEAQRCSQWSRAEGLSPLGTAGTPAGFVLVDWPLPWPGDLGEIAALADVRRLAGERGLRIQATVPVATRPARVALYVPRPGPGFAGYEGREADAGAGEGSALRAALEELLGGGGLPISEGEVLVCTHGRRDVCCGSMGTTLAMELTGATMSEGRVTSLGAGVMDRPVRRTSHTGGHRFAPNAIVFPEGTVWGFVDRDLLVAVTTRTGSLDDLAPRYRGCAGLASPQLQAMEAHVLAEVGWSLFDSVRTGEHIDGDRYRLRLDGPDGPPRSWESTVVEGRRLTIPECGRPIGESHKTTVELAVSDLQPGA
jgi:hypothetical protein